MSRLLDWGLAGRAVIVTGGAGAIGGAIAEGFAEAGARVAVLDRETQSAEAAAAALAGEGHAGFGADLAAVAGLPDLVAAIEARMGPCTVLCNVAGVIRRNPDLLSVTEAEWDGQHAVNLKAVFFLSQAFAARLIAAGRGGAIVNTTSQGWWSGGYAGSVVYNAAKGGVATMTRGLARAWAPHGIRVNALAPGLVETPMLVTPETTPAEVAALVAQIPLGRLGQPADHAGAAVFLASDLAAYVTGATLNVSGGFLMY
jgi:NAD(P)-dependent dehydrogenase (short-subunit alcohol dehydrogenase family)